MDCPVCFDKPGVYLARQCGHGLCEDCICKVLNIPNAKCPTCRAVFMERPLLIQAFASTLADGVVRSLNDKFNMLWPTIKETPAITQTPVMASPTPHVVNQNDVAQNELLAVTQVEFNSGVTLHGNVETLQPNNARHPLKFMDIQLNIAHYLENQWVHIPFTDGPLVFHYKFDVYPPINNPGGMHVRRYIKVGLNMIDFIKNIEQRLEDHLSTESGSLRSEIQIRHHRYPIPYYSLGVHTVRPLSAYDPGVVKIICFGAWYHRYEFGLRFHVV